MMDRGIERAGASPLGAWVEGAPDARVDADAEALPAAGVTEEEALAATAGAARRAGLEAADAALVAEAASAIGGLSDPGMLLQLVHTWIRDLGLEVREEGARTAAQSASLAGERVLDALEAQRVAAERAAQEGEIAKICGYIGSGLALVAGAIGAAFTGGASLGLAVAAVVLIAGALATQIVADVAPVSATDRENAGVASLCMSILATVCSLGAAAAGTGGAAAGTGARIAADAGAAAASTTARATADGAAIGVRIATDACSYASATFQTVEGGEGIVSSVFAHDAAMRGADGAEAREERDDETDRMAADVEAARSLMRAFARMAEAFADVREARTACTRAAILRA